MEKLQTAILFFRKKLGMKDKASETEEEIGKYSMNEGEPDKVFGFRREVVKGVVIFFGTVLVLASIFASSEDEEENKPVDTLPVATASEVSSVRKPKNELPNDYETLIAMNKAREEELRRQEEEKLKNAVKNNPPEKPVAVETPPPVVTVPQIPLENYEVLPPIPQISKLTEENLETEKPKIEEIKESKSDKYKAPISFKLNDQNTAKNVENESEKQATPTKLEYVSPDNRTLVAGTIIPVRLLTGINTDLEGQVMVQILADVYDTATGTQILIPQGSKLTGTYKKKAVNNGRVAVTFKQLMLPNGGSWSISENIVAVDGAGYTGIAGKVHHHTGQKISAGAIGASIAALGSLASGNVSANNNTYTAGQIAAQGAMGNLIDATSSLLKESAKIENTVTIEPGYEFNVYVTNNITF